MISIQVSNKKQGSKFEHALGPLEFGRGPKRLVERFLVNDVFVSRDQLRIEELPNGNLQVENLSAKQEIGLGDGSKIAVGVRRELAMPVRLVIGQTQVDIAAVAGDVIDRKSLGTISQPAATGSSDGTVMLLPLKELGAAPAPEVLANWLETVVGLQRWTAGAADFYRQTARALVESIGLDSGLILIRKDLAWELAGHFPQEKNGAPPFSRTLLSHVATERRTFYQDLNKLGQTESLEGLCAAVVAPIFGSRDEVIGALYGVRRTIFAGAGITPLEAQMVQLLAAVVGANLIRLQALRSQAQHDQFPRALSAELKRDPELAEGQEKEVSLLVARVPGYAELAQELGGMRACQLARELMTRLEERIGEQNGVLVEVKGDGLLAMWNAPLDQRDHALMACAAALGVREEMNELNSRWQTPLTKPLGLQVALHTGLAQVGNMGSARQFCYRPFGQAADSAGRLLEAAARLGRPLLMSAGTQQYLPDTMATRRLCQVRLKKGGEAVALYELHGVSATPQWLLRRDTYESALMQYEFGQWARACATLLPLLQQAGHDEHPDVPSLKLARQICACMEREPAAFDPVFDLETI